MTQADHDRQIDYVEFVATDIGRTKQFYQQVFGWRFEDYGPDYTSFQDGRLSGGFTKDAPVPAPPPPVGVYAPQTPADRGKNTKTGGENRRAHIPFSGCRPIP